MIYKHGAYSIDVHVLDVAVEPEYNSAGLLMRRVRRHTIEGVVRGADQAAIKTAIQAFETAFSTTVTKSGFYHSDGTTESGHMIDVSGGVVTEKGIVAQWHWTSDPIRAEYVTYRSFLATIDAAFIGPGGDEYEYSNRIIRIGDGGPIFTARPTLDAGVVMQQIYPSSPFIGIEVGRKVSRAGLVAVQDPTFPLILQHHNMQRETGRESGADGVTRYFASWQYNYLSNTAF